MNYQPPSFESYIGSFEVGENRPLSPLSPRNAAPKKKIVLKSSARDTPTKSRRSRGPAEASPRVNKTETSLLNAGLSASEMLARLRKEKEVLVRRQGEIEREESKSALSLDDEDVNEEKADSTDAEDSTGAPLNQIAILPKTLVPPPPPNPPRKHKQTVMASPRAKSRQSGKFQFEHSSENHTVEKEDSKEPEPSKAITNEAQELKQDADQAKLIQSHLNQSAETKKTDKGGPGLVQRGKALFGKKRESDPKKKKPTRLELARLRSLSILGSKSTSPSSFGSNSEKSVSLDGKDVGTNGKSAARKSVDEEKSERRDAESSDEDTPSNLGEQAGVATEADVQEHTVEAEGKEEMEAPAQKVEALVAGFNVSRLRKRRENKSLLNRKSDESKRKLKARLSSESKEKECNSDIDTKKEEEPAVQSIQKSKIGVGKPMDKFGRDKKKTAGVNQAMSRASSAMAGISTTRSARRRPVGASTSTEDDVSVVSSAVSVASSVTAVQGNGLQMSRSAKGKFNTLDVSTQDSKPSTNAAFKKGHTHSALLSRAQTHRRAASNASAPQSVTSAGELDDAAIFSDLLPPSPTCREQSVERNIASAPSRNTSLHLKRGRRTRSTSISKGDYFQDADDDEGSSPVSTVLKSPPRMIRDLPSGVAMLAMNSETPPRIKVSTTTPKATAPSPKSKIVPTSPSLNRLVRRNRSLSRSRLARNQSPSSENVSVDAPLKNLEPLPDYASDSPDPSAQTKTESPSTPTRVRPLSAFQAARRGGRSLSRNHSNARITMGSPGNTTEEALDAVVTKEAAPTSDSPVPSSQTKIESPSTPTRVQSLSAFRAARRGGRSLSRNLPNAPITMDSPGNTTEKALDAGDAKGAASTPPPIVELEKTSKAFGSRKTESLAALRSVTRRGRQSSSPASTNRASTTTTPKRSHGNRGIKSDEPASTNCASIATAPPRSADGSNFTPPARFDRRSRSEFQSRGMAPTPDNQSPQIAASPAVNKPSGSPIDARHAVATQMRRNFRRRSNSLQRSQSNGKPEENSTAPAGVAREIDPDSKAQMILHGRFAATPRAASDSASVASHTAVVSILNRNAKKKSTFYVPIAQLCETVLPIQALARVFLAKLAVKKRRKAIVRLQAIFRRWSCQHYLSSCVFLAVKLQACHRGYVAREQTYFIHLGVLAVIRLQACYRGNAARRDLRYQSYCATRIQALIRGYWQCFDYVQTWSNIVLLQSIVRMRSSRNKFLVEQAARKKALEDAAATKIQALWRTFICYTDFSNDRIDIVAIQCAARRWLARKLFIEQAARKKALEDAAATKIQALWRSFICYTDFSNDRIDIVAIQCAARGWLARRQLNKMQMEQSKCHGATLIATCWRGFIVRREYIITVGDLILCQSVFRRKMAIKQKKILLYDRRVSCAMKIQASWRGYVAHYDFVHTISDIIIVQSFVRRCISSRIKRDLLEQLRMRSATRIQTAWRGCTAFNSFIHVVSNVIVVQSLVRKFQAIKYVRQLMNEWHILINESATKIAAAWRRFYAVRCYKYDLADIILVQTLARRLSSTRVRRRLTKEYNQRRESSATKITSNWRRHSANRGYKCRMADIITCQAVIRRRMSINKAERLKHKLRTLCATLIQAQWRSYLARESLICTVVQIMTVQSVCRKWLAIRLVSKLRKEMRESQIMLTARRVAQVEGKAATKIASAWKPFFHQDKFAEKKSSIVIIQARWRGFIAFEKYIQTIFYLLTIQAFARRLIACFRVNKMREERQLQLTVIKMQSLVRRNIAVKKFLDRIKWRNRLQACACICIQAVYRGHVVRDSVSVQVTAATKIQSFFRCFVGKLSYAVALSSIIICQSACRRRLVKSDMTRKQLASTKIASAFRGYVDRMDYIVTVSGVIICQSIVRRKLACREADILQRFQCEVQQSAATSIQRFLRGYFAKMNYIVQLMNIIISQSTVRRWLETKKVNQLRAIKQITAATVIQKRYRGYVKFTEYIEAVVNIIICQAVSRKYIACKKVQHIKDSILEETRIISATKIAATYRSHIAYSSYNATLTDIILCQAYFRRWNATRSVSIKKQSWLSAAVVIQSSYRGYIQSVLFILTLSRIIMLQSQVRGHLARNFFKREKARLDSAATMIQKNWRSFKVETDFIMTLAGIISIQANIRRFLQMSNYTMIQDKRAVAATKIQSLFRSNIYFDDYTHSLVNITLCQSFVRKWLAKRKALILRQQKSQGEMVTIIQSKWRGYTARCDYIIMILDIISAQSHVRRRAAMKKLTHLRKQRDSAIKIQATARGYISYTKYVFTLIDIIFCQAIVRSKLARIRKSKLRYEQVSHDKAALCIQACWKTFVANKCMYSMVLIQAFVRRHIARKRFAKIKAYDACRNRALIRFREKAAAIVLQKSWKQFKTRRLHSSATSIQRKWKAYIHSLQDARSTLENVILIQAIMRRFLTKRRIAAALQCVAISESENIMRIELEASIILQRWWEKRSYLLRIQRSCSSDFSVQVQHAAAAMIQTAFRGYRAFSQYVIISYFILKIQAATRGYLARSSFLRRKKMVEQWQGLSHVHRPLARQSLPHVQLIQDPSKLVRQSSPPEHYFNGSCRQNGFSESSQSPHQFHKQKTQQKQNSARKLMISIPPTPDIARKVMHMREKHAALVIERFFITIKAEIDHEVKLLERKQKKRGKRALKCDTGVNSNHGSSLISARHNVTAPHHVESFDYSRQSSSGHNSQFMTPQVQQFSHASTRYPNMNLQQNQHGVPITNRSGVSDYQSRCMDASGYSSQQSYTRQQGSNSGSRNGSCQRSIRRSRTGSEESSVQSIEVTQTRSETEVRLAKLQHEVAGLVSRYQVAEGELQSVSHSMDPSNSSYHGESANYRRFGNDISSRASQENCSVEHDHASNGPTLNATLPRAPLQQRLNHLDITPPRLSYSRQCRPPTQHENSPSFIPLHPQHQRTSSLHEPIPMRYTNSTPHLNSSCPSPQINHMYFREQQFPPIPSSSQSNNGVAHNLSIGSTDSYGSPQNKYPSQGSQQIPSQHPYQGQSPMNYYNPSPSFQRQSQKPIQPQQHYTMQRTPSGRQF